MEIISFGIYTIILALCCKKVLPENIPRKNVDNNDKGKKFANIEGIVVP
jgi:hypothetical protein